MGQVIAADQVGTEIRWARQYLQAKQQKGPSLSRGIDVVILRKGCDYQGEEQNAENGGVRRGSEGRGAKEDGRWQMGPAFV
jgi:transcription termination factor Rho